MLNKYSYMFILGTQEYPPDHSPTGEESEETATVELNTGIIF